MIWETIAVSVGVLGALLGALTSIVFTGFKFRAERRFKKRATEAFQGDEIMRTEIIKVVEQLRASDPGPELTVKADSLIKQMLQTLDEPDQERILQGLQQPTDIGRSFYRRKLLSS